MTEPTRLPFQEGIVVRLKGDATFSMVVIPDASDLAPNKFPKKVSVTWVAYRCGDNGISIVPMPTVALEEVPPEDMEKARVRALGGPSLADLLKDLGVDASLLRNLQQAKGSEMDA